MRFSESVRHWLNAQFSWREMKALDQETIAQLARDNGMAVSDFFYLANSKTANSDLLTRQLSRAGLNPETVADTKSRVMRDMQIVCSGCFMTRRCRRELSRKDQNRDYSVSCPSAPTIDTLTQDLLQSRPAVST